MSERQYAKIEPTVHIGSASPRALVVGGGTPALVAAQALREMSVDVTFAKIARTPSHVYLALPGPGIDDELTKSSPELDGIEVINMDGPPVVRRDDGGFKASFEDGMEKFYDCVLLAPGISLKPKLPSLPENIELFTSHIEIGSAERVAFLLDYEHPSDPTLGMYAIKAAAQHVVNGGDSVVCFRQVPVAHLFGETLYDEARRVGVQFARFGDELPIVSCLGNMEGSERFRLTLRDVIDNREESVFQCDRVFVVTGPDASSIPKWAMGMVGHGGLDDQGFALSESVYCSSGVAFASGVFIVGEATGSLDVIRGIEQAKAAAAKAYAWMRTSCLKTKDEPVSIASACVGCLTCYRVCPHGAISVKPGTSGSTIAAWPSLCRECGICVSVCPSVAINLNTFPDDYLLASVKEVPQTDMHRTTFVFGCQRSAGLLSQLVQVPEHVRFLAVPCAGRVSEYVMWHALAAGARGVLVVGCHQGNCASRTGTDWAAARIGRGLATGLFRPGQRRLGYATVAANEPARFQRLLREFAADALKETPEATSR
jgi:quinone-modifying oxidoreductase, subunit QmoB